MDSQLEHPKTEDGQTFRSDTSGVLIVTRLQPIGLSAVDRRRLEYDPQQLSSVQFRRSFINGKLTEFKVQHNEMNTRGLFHRLARP